MDCVWNCYRKYRSPQNLRHSYQENTVEGEEEPRLRQRVISPDAILPQNRESHVLHENEKYRPGITGESSGTISSCYSAFLRLSPSCCRKNWFSDMIVSRGVCDPSPQRSHSDSELVAKNAASVSTEQEQQLLLQLVPTSIAAHTDSNISDNSSTSNIQTGSSINAESSECIQMSRLSANQMSRMNRKEDSSSTISNSSQAAVANLGSDDQ